MRLWSLHPRYLDAKGLVALWRETLLAQAVLAGRTRGYTRHPQLRRFQAVPAPAEQVAAYLRAVHDEAAERGYRFDASRIGPHGVVAPLTVTHGQLAYEWAHLLRKLETRAPELHERWRNVGAPEPHPLFRVIDGEVEAWEVVTPPSR